MPAPLDVDRDAVRAHVLQHGVRAAARHYGLPESTVQSWSSRHRWLADHVAVLPPPHLRPPASTMHSDAAGRAMDRLSGASKLRLAQAVHHGAKHAAKLSGDKVLANAADIKALAATGDTVHGWTDERQAGAGKLCLDLRLVAGGEPAALDIEATVEPVEQLPENG